MIAKLAFNPPGSRYLHLGKERSNCSVCYQRFVTEQVAAKDPSELRTSSGAQEIYRGPE